MKIDRVIELPSFWKFGFKKNTFENVYLLGHNCIHLIQVLFIRAIYRSMLNILNSYSSSTSRSYENFATAEIIKDFPLNVPK